MKKFLLIVLMLIFSAGYTFAQKHITINEDCVYLDELTASHIPHNKVECGIKAGSETLITKDVIQSHLDKAGIKGTVLNDILVSREWEKLSYEKVAEYIEAEHKKAYPDMKIVVDQIRIAENIYDNPNVKMNISCDTSKLGGGYAQIKLDNNKYQIYYYYDNVRDTNKTLTFYKPVGTIIDSYVDQLKKGYVLDKTENYPLTITENVKENIIKVYYIKEGSKKPEPEPEQTPTTDENQVESKKPEEKNPKPDSNSEKPTKKNQVMTIIALVFDSFLFLIIMMVGIRLILKIKNEKTYRD